jgi:predicted nucleic acid-binding protein
VEIIIVLLLGLSIVLAIMFGRVQAADSARAERDIALGKAVDATARAEIADDDAKRAEKARQVTKEVFDESKKTEPIGDRIAARWDRLRDAYRDGGETSPGDPPIEVRGSSAAGTADGRDGSKPQQ